jgi:predicted dehydrogenase
VNLHASWLNPRKARDITVVGENRMLRFDDMDLNEPLRIYDKQLTDARIPPTYVDSFASSRASVRKGNVTVAKVPIGEPLATQCAHFLECIVSGKHPFTGAPEGIAVVRSLEAIERSQVAARTRTRLEYVDSCMTSGFSELCAPVSVVASN